MLYQYLYKNNVHFQAEGEKKKTKYILVKNNTSIMH